MTNPTADPTANPQPFKISISDEALRDLHTRIDNARWPDSLEEVGWAYGTDADYLRELVEQTPTAEPMIRRLRSEALRRRVPRPNLVDGMPNPYFDHY